MRITLMSIAIMFSQLAHSQGLYDRGADTRTNLPERIFKERQNWGADFALGYTEYSGNAVQQSGSAALTLFKRFEKVTSYLDAGQTYGRSRGVVSQNKRHGILRFDWRKNENFKWFAFNTHGFNQFLKLDYRTTVGAGPWYDFIGEKWKNGLSLAPTYYYEEFKGQRAKNEGGVSLRNYFTYDISKTSSFGLDMFYAPRMKELRDFHFFLQPFMSVKVYKEIVSLRLSYALEYDSRPLPGVRQGDRTYMTNVNFAVGE